MSPRSSSTRPGSPARSSPRARRPGSRAPACPGSRSRWSPRSGTSVAALRFALCADSSHVPPPTLPTEGVESPGHCGIGAAAICPAGVLNVPWNNAPPYHDGPGIIRILLASFLSKSELKTLLVARVWFWSNVSSSDRHPRAVLARGVDRDRLGCRDLVGAALAGPQVDLGREHVTGGPDQVTGMLGGDLFAERLVLGPGRRDGVAPLLHQRGVVPEHGLRQVVAQAVERAVDHARVVGARAPSRRAWTAGSGPGSAAR